MLAGSSWAKSFGHTNEALTHSKPLAVAQRHISCARVSSSVSGVDAPTASVLKLAAAGQKQRTSKPKISSATELEQELQAGVSDNYPRDADGDTVVYAGDKLLAGETAGILAKVLRTQDRAALQFIGGQAAVKALKVLTMANHFLNQHGSALSFVPTLLGNITTAAEAASAGDSSTSTSDANAQHSSASHSTSSSNPRWSVSVWTRQMKNPEFDLKANQMYDFSLDNRLEWKRKASVSEDLAFSIADLVYGQLVPAPKRSGNSTPQPPWQLTPQQMQFPSTRPDSMPISRTPKSQPRRDPMLISSDMAQAVTVLAALSLMEQRLRREGSLYHVACTLFRNTVAPRPDGRNGFVFKIHLIASRTLLQKRNRSGRRPWHRQASEQQQEQE